MNIHSGGEELLHVGSWSDKRTDEGAEGRTDMKKLIVEFL